jgi:putative salt-induced outer membrane protein YdiY
MWSRISSAFICTVFPVILCQSLFADEIRMRNGDRITGKIIRMENKVLTISTSYAAELAVQWPEVESMETDSAVHIVLEDKTSTHGLVTTAGTGELELTTQDVTEPIRFVTGRVKVINPPPSESPVKLSGNINVGMDVNKGNTDTEAYHLDGEIKARTKSNRYAAGGEVNQEEESGEETADNWFIYMGYDHFVTKKCFFYTNANFEQDDFKDLNLRSTLGAGWGYQFFESELLNLSLKAGPAYVNEDYTVHGQDNDYAAGRWAVEYDQYFLETSLQLFHNHEAIIGLEDTEDMIVRTATGVRIPLGESFDTTMQYNWDWDNTPASGNERVDERYLFTLGYRWE